MNQLDSAEARLHSKIACMLVFMRSCIGSTRSIKFQTTKSTETSCIGFGFKNSANLPLSVGFCSTMNGQL